MKILHNLLLSIFQVSGEYNPKVGKEMLKWMQSIQ